MARKRMIDPSIWDDPSFGDLGPRERLLFIGLFSNADDEGRIQADPRYLRKRVFGYDDMDLAEVCRYRDTVLATFRKLQLYSVDGREYIQFLNWKQYQNISHPTASVLPPMPSDSRIILEPSQNDSGTIPGSIVSIDKSSIDEIRENGADAQALTPKQAHQQRAEELRAKGDIITVLGKAHAEGMGWPPQRVAKTTYHSSWAPHLLAAHDAGWHPDDMLHCTRYVRTEPYWRDKDPPLRVIVGKLPEWERLGRPEHYEDRKNGRVVDPNTPTCKSCHKPIEEYVYARVQVDGAPKRIKWCYHCQGEEPDDDI